MEYGVPRKRIVAGPIRLYDSRIWTLLRARYGCGTGSVNEQKFLNSSRGSRPFVPSLTGGAVDTFLPRNFPGLAVSVVCANQVCAGRGNRARMGCFSRP